MKPLLVKINCVILQIFKVGLIVFFLQVDLGKFLKKLIKVSSDNHDALQSLANRINFNEFYSKQDEELEKCATYICRSDK